MHFIENEFILQARPGYAGQPGERGEKGERVRSDLSKGF
jgi:hypothetical protein